MSSTYILLDAMGIQSYIFKTNTLKIILGSSLALARWQVDCRDICLKSRGDLITSAGGNVLARFDGQDFSNQALGFKDACLQKAPPGMEIAWAKVNDNGKKDLEIWSDLQREIARYKAGDRDQSDYPPSPLTFPLSGCKHCGVGPDDGQGKVPDRSICKDCRDLHGKSDQLNNPTDKTSIEKICSIPLENSGKFTFPVRLDELVTNERDEQELLAVAVFDLNDMGIKVRETVERSGFDELCNFSSKLEEDFSNVFKEVIRELPLVLDSKKTKTIRLRPLMIGGDDAVFAMPASLWIFFVQKTLSKLKEKELSACAGVALAKHTYPINRLVQMAEELASNAKNRYRWENKAGDAVIDWHLHQETSFTSPIEIRKRNYIPIRQEDNLYEISTRRPYTLGELEELIKKAEKLKGLSGRKLFSLYRALRRGTVETRNTLVYTFLRDEQDDLKKYQPLWDWIRDIPGDEPLWEKTEFVRGSYKPSLYDTKIADIIELGWLLES